MSKIPNFIYLLITLLLIISNINAKTWTKVDSSQDGLYYILRCPDSLNFMIYEERRSHSRFHFRGTTDGGKNWENKFQYTGTIGFYIPLIHDMSYPNTKLCIAVGDSGIIFRSTDNGVNWQYYFFDRQIQLFEIQMADENFGIMFGHNYNNLNIPNELMEE